MSTHNVTSIGIIDKAVLVTVIPSLGVFSYSSRRKQSMVVIISTVSILEHLYTSTNIGLDAR